MKRWLAIFALLLARVIPASVVCAATCRTCTAQDGSADPCVGSSYSACIESCGCCSNKDESPEFNPCSPSRTDECGCVMCPHGLPPDRSQLPAGGETKSSIELAFLRAGRPGCYPLVYGLEPPLPAPASSEAVPAPDADAGVARARLCSWTI